MYGFTLNWTFHTKGLILFFSLIGRKEMKKLRSLTEPGQEEKSRSQHRLSSYSQDVGRLSSCLCPKGLEGAGPTSLGWGEHIRLLRPSHFDGFPVYMSNKMFAVAGGRGPGLHPQSMFSSSSR